MTNLPGPACDMAATGRAFDILVVCTANICRSPMAEHLLRDALASAELATSPPTRFVVGSAGIRGWDGQPMDAMAAAELRRLDGDPTNFRARSFTAALAQKADLVLTATTDHRRIVLEEVPQALHRTFTLLEFAHLTSRVASVRHPAGSPLEIVRRAATNRGAARLDDYDVLDPYGQFGVVHHQVAEVIRQASSVIAGVFVARF